MRSGPDWGNGARSRCAGAGDRVALDRRVGQAAQDLAACREPAAVPTSPASGVDQHGGVSPLEHRPATRCVDRIVFDALDADVDRAAAADAQSPQRIVRQVVAHDDRLDRSRSREQPPPQPTVRDIRPRARIRRFRPGRTNIRVPSRRYALPFTRTTVASATRSVAACACRIASSSRSVSRRCIRPTMAQTERADNLGAFTGDQERSTRRDRDASHQKLEAMSCGERLRLESREHPGTEADPILVRICPSKSVAWGVVRQRHW